MQLKRILGIFLAAALIFSVPAAKVGAEAVETFEVGVETNALDTPVSTSPKIINNGDDVSVEISVAQNTGISFLSFVVYYDVDALEYVDYSSADLFGQSKGSVTVRDGYLWYKLNLNTEISDKQGELLSINFKAKSGYCGNTKIYTALAQNSSANCARYESVSKNAHVPFVAGEDTFAIHSINASEGVVTNPTCTENGFTTYICSTCNEEVVGNIVDATGHTAADAVEENRVEATCTDNGSYDSVVYCADCHTELSRENFVINTLEHKYGETTVIEPEYKQDGYSTHTCTVCGYEEKFDFKPALTYILGDINGDETVNDADAVYLLMHTFFPEDYPINQVGDFDGDGAVTDADAVYILMYTFFPEDYPIA